MPKTLLVTLAVLAVAIGTAATWASAGARQPSSSMAGMKGMKMEVASPALATALSKARVSTVKYVTNLNAAKEAGYSIITKGIPDMGWHFLNGKITGFDPAKPPILVYEKTGSTWQLGALEWVFTARSRRRATTQTGRSSPPRRRMPVPPPLRAPARSSPSGTRT